MPGRVNNGGISQNEEVRAQERPRKLWEAAREMFGIAAVLTLKFMAIIVSWGNVRNELPHEVLLKGLLFDIRLEGEGRERE